jgi:tetratricopeptide (TPR) repeat protein
MNRSAVVVTGPRCIARRGVFSLLIAFVNVVQAGSLSDANRQVIQQTSMDGILRITAAQGGRLSDNFAGDLPPDLSPGLRQALDANLDYNKMESDVTGLMASKLMGSARAGTGSFWGSSEGREIARAEARAYASLIGDSSFNVFNSAPPATDSPSADAIEEAVLLARLPEFATAMLQRTGPIVGCLIAEVADPTLTTCSDFTLSPDQLARLTRRSAQLIRASYSTVSAGALQAYLIYLRSADNSAVVAALQAATLDVTERCYQRAQAAVSSVLKKYAETRYSTVDERVLREILANIDEGRELKKARFTLALMRRGAPPNAGVLMQLARVTLKLAPNHSGPESEPYVPSLDRREVLLAKAFITEALSLASADPDVVMIAGHTAYLAGELQQAVDLLEKARALGGQSPWLHVNLGDALYAVAFQPPQIKREILQRAAERFEAALKEKLPPAAESRAVHQLGPIYADLGDLRRAETYYRRYVSLQDGDQNRAYATHRYGIFLLFFPHDYDGAIAAARAALALYDFGFARDFLVQALAVKGGSLVMNGHAKDAAPFLEEARRLDPHLEFSAPEWGRLAATYPGVVGAHASGALPSFAGRLGGETLVRSMLYATPAQIEQMLSWGADPNYLDPEEGTPLQFAILADNVAAVQNLLTHGANARTPFIDGRLPCELAAGDDPRRKVTLAMVLKATGGGPCGGDPNFPLKVDHAYRLKKEMTGVINGATWGSNSFEAGEILVFQSACNLRYTDSTVMCLLFKKIGPDGLPIQNGRLFDFAIAKSDLISWQELFEEVQAKRLAGQHPH